jgi:hypothetical protein
MNQPKPNKTDAGNGSKAICRVSNVLRSPSPDPRRSANSDTPLTMLRGHDTRIADEDASGASLTP